MGYNPGVSFQVPGMINDYSSKMRDSFDKMGDERKETDKKAKGMASIFDLMQDNGLLPPDDSVQNHSPKELAAMFDAIPQSVAIMGAVAQKKRAEREAAVYTPGVETLPTGEKIFRSGPNSAQLMKDEPAYNPEVITLPTGEKVFRTSANSAQLMTDKETAVVDPRFKTYQGPVVQFDAQTYGKWNTAKGYYDIEINKPGAQTTMKMGSNVMTQGNPGIQIDSFPRWRDPNAPPSPIPSRASLMGGMPQRSAQPAMMGDSVRQSAPVSPNGVDQQIVEAYKAGKISYDEAARQLQALGYTN